MEQLVCVPSTFIWSAEFINDKSVLIKYNYHPEFEKLIKDINMRKWNSVHKGWTFKIYRHGEVVSKIKRAFPEWEFRDLRNTT